MKNTKFLKAFKVLALAIFLSYSFLPFRLTQKAEAACNYGITRMDAQSAATRTDNLRLNTTVTRSGTAGDCANTVTVVFYLKADYMIPTGDQVISADNLEITRASISFGNSSAQSLTTSYNLSQLDWTKIPNQNQLQLFMRVYANNQFAQQSSNWPIAVTGTTGSGGPSGSKNITITFDRASYSSGDRVDVYMRVDNANAPDVEIVTFVKTKEVGHFERTGSSLGGATFQSVIVNDTNGFTNGSNEVTVKMFQKGTNRQILFAQGSAQLQAAGLTNNPATPGSGTKKWACKDGSGKYVCGDKQDLSDAGITPLSPSDSGECEASAFKSQQVDVTYCGKTDAQIQAAGGGNGSSTVPFTGSIINPIGTEDLVGTFLSIVKGFLTGIAIWAVMAIIIGGFRMVIAAGNEEALGVAKKSITWAIIGLVVAMLSFSIVAIVQNIIGVDINKINPSGYENIQEQNKNV